MIRVLLAEDQAMVRGALAALLRLEDDIEVVAELARGDEVLPAALETRPDIALLDIEMPGGGGLSATQSLHERLPSCRNIGGVIDPSHRHHHVRPCILLDRGGLGKDWHVRTDDSGRQRSAG